MNGERLEPIPSLSQSGTLAEIEDSPDLASFLYDSFSETRCLRHAFCKTRATINFINFPSGEILFRRIGSLRPPMLVSANIVNIRAQPVWDWRAQLVPQNRRARQWRARMSRTACPGEWPVSHAWGEMVACGHSIMNAG